MQDRIRKIVEETLAVRLRMAYFAVDKNLRLTLLSDNLLDYGYENVAVGDAADQHFDFMTGIAFDTRMELPFMRSDSGTAINVNFYPSKEDLAIIITDASNAAQDRQQLQQAANENELLVEQLQKLMAKLAQASSELEDKNKQLKEASRLQTGFLSGVSHEFRTPLTSIIGYTELLLNSSDSPTPKSDSANEHLQAVQRSSKHLLSLIENLLDHGKLDADEILIRPKPTNLNELIRDVDLLLRPLADAKSIGLEFESELKNDCFVFVDDSRVRQCLINIVGNAIKFTDTGGVNVSLVYRDEALDVRVEDSGLGISSEDLEKIRLPFFQAADTGKVGTGLGLTITEKIIELMGGKMSIGSTLGKGTVVEFSTLAPEVEESDPGTNQPEVSANQLKILLAEDDEDIALLVTTLLTESGVDVEHVVNGQLAVESLQRNDFDLCLMDIHMPIMSGYEAMAVLQEQGNKTPIVVMSASAIEADQQQAAELGCAAYLVKPVDVSDILALADTLMGEQV